MGGITTLGALTAYDWIKAGVSLMGSPNYVELFQRQIDHIQSQGIEIDVPEEKVQELMERLELRDLSLQPEKLRQRPLLFWHGVKIKSCLTRRPGNFMTRSNPTIASDRNASIYRR